VLFLVIPIVFGAVTMIIAANNGRDTSAEKVGWFLLGYFFPLIGLIVALIIGPKAPAADRSQPPPPR
jgi:Na+/H+-dicarboxylate symporter